MKKFLIIMTIVFMLMSNLMVEVLTNKRIYTDNTYFTKIKDKEIYIDKNGKWENIDIVGVNLESTKPGTFPSENDISHEEYLRWITYIYDMGADCIKVPNLMGYNFYNALAEFNQNKENPIYLVQGIYFDEEKLKDGYDPQTAKLEKMFRTNIKLIIDSVHGNPYSFEKPDILKMYKTDISKYLIGYTLGIEFASRDIIYTEIMNDDKAYNGEYFYTNESASSLESYLAKMADYAVSYEMDSYKSQKLIGFVGSSLYNVINNKENSNKDNNIELGSENKDTIKDFIEIENIKTKRKLKTGMFASYSLYPSYSEIREYQENIDGYLSKINEHHKIPIVVGELGIPSARVAGDFKNNGNGYIDEKEQGESLVKVYNAIKNSDFAGSFIFQFQDSWNNSSWNTKDSKILDRSVYWSDTQTYSQQFGLMTFDPGKEETISYPDESIEEWSQDQVISKNEDISLSMKSDEKYLYFMAKTKNELDLKSKDIYIDLDITPRSGSYKSSQFGLEFEEPVDFIINIKDKENASVLVHEYYNRFKFYENKIQNMKRPDLIKHTKDMDKFSPIYIETRPKMYVKSINGFAEKLAYESGKLVHGNGNPSSKDFNSVSDFYIGKNFVEIRIPWDLLNFMDPSTKQIQDDFYELFETRPLKINNIKVGLTIKEENQTLNRIASTDYDLDGWVMPKYHERLKKSYYIIKDELSKD